MTSSRRRSLLSSFLLCTLLALLPLATGCSSEEEPEVPAAGDAAVVERDSTPSGPAISRAGVNPPAGETFTCWILGSGFQSGDKVLVNGTKEIPTTFGHPGLVTFAGGVDLLEGRAALTLVVVRPGTELRSNPFDAPIPVAPPRG